MVLTDVVHCKMSFCAAPFFKWNQRSETPKIAVPLIIYDNMFRALPDKHGRKLNFSMRNIHLAVTGTCKA